MQTKTNEERLDKLFLQMIAFDEKDAKRIQHFTKVHSYARLIGRMEHLPEDELTVLEAAAYVHDIGIRIAEEKYGKNNGKLQEELGAEPARKMMLECGFSEEQAERAAYLVGHHHTYTNITETDYQILVEADFLVNLFEDGSSAETVKNVYDTIFKTESGKQICREMFGV